MTPLQECIAECGTDAPLHTVPSDKHPKPMVVRFLYTDNRHDLICRIEGLRFTFRNNGQHRYASAPDITPVMPKLGERWVTRNGEVLRLVELAGSLVAWLPHELEDGTEAHCIDQWGRCIDRKYANFDLILPYIEPHD